MKSLTGFKINSRVLAPGKSSMPGFTLMELTAVMVIAGVLAVTLPLTLARTGEQAESELCRNNLRQIGLGVHLYAQDWGGWAPRASGSGGGDPKWRDFLLDGEYIPEMETWSNKPHILVCPGWPPQEGRPTGTLAHKDNIYGMRSRYRSEQYLIHAPVVRAYHDPPGGWNWEHKPPERFVLIADSVHQNYPETISQRPHIRTSSPRGAVHLRHDGGRANNLFADGHVESMSRDDYLELAEDSKTTYTWTGDEIYDRSH